jgi:hypothetical protein
MQQDTIRDRHLHFLWNLSDIRRLVLVLFFSFSVDDISPVEAKVSDNLLLSNAFDGMCLWTTLFKKRANTLRKTH